MQFETRSAASVFAVATLLAVTVFCPLLICAQPAPGDTHHDCCPSSHHQSKPCGSTSMTCPYQVLETVNSVSVPLAVAPPAIISLAPPAMYSDAPALPAAAVLPAGDLYLRNRVLLI